jgi:hypothetical protein
LNPASGNGSILLKSNITLTGGKAINTSDNSAISIPFGITTLSGIVANGTISGLNFSGTSSGTNTGDETLSTIKTKLGITTLSGSNTGDQDLSVLVPKTYTVNGHALSSNVSVTPTDLGLVIGTNVLAQRTFGTAANSATTDFAPAVIGGYLPLSAGSGNALTGTLYGTNAIFSTGNVSLNGGSLKINNSPDTKIELQNGGATKVYFALSNSNGGHVNGSIPGDAIIRTEGGGFGISTNSGSSFAQYINSSGATTFSSTVGATQFNASGNYFTGGNYYVGPDASYSYISPNTYTGIYFRAQGGLFNFSNGLITSPTANFTNLTTNYLPKQGSGGLVNSLISIDTYGAIINSDAATLQFKNAGTQFGYIASSAYTLGTGSDMVVFSTSGNNIDILSQGTTTKTARFGTNGVVNIYSTTSSTSSTTGALVVGGGIGVAGKVYTSAGFVKSKLGNGTDTSPYEDAGITYGGTGIYFYNSYNVSAGDWMAIKTTGVYVNITATRFSINGLGNAIFSGSVTSSSLGTGSVYSNGGTLTNTIPSDMRLKNTVNPLGYGLAEILKLQPKSFYYNDDTNHQRLQYGFIAQEVQQIMPDVVRPIGNGSDMLGLETNGIYVAGIKAIQELDLQVNDLSSLDTTSATSLGSLIKSFLADVTNGISSIYANTFNAKEKICVDGECLTKDDIHYLLEMKNSESSLLTKDGAGGGSSVVVPTCTATQSLVNNVCIDPAPTAEEIAAQKLIDDKATADAAQKLLDDKTAADKLQVEADAKAKQDALDKAAADAAAQVPVEPAQ